MKNLIVKNTLILTAITLVAGLCLGFVYEITKEPIAIAQEKAKQEAYKEVFVDAESFVAIDGFATLDIENSTITEVVAANDGSEDIGYVITVTNHEGYGGDIVLTMGIKNDGTINGISFLTLAETAGLGMNAGTDSFKSQYADKQVEAFSVTKSGAASDSEIDAISGATITTTAVTNGVNAGISYFENELGGGADE